MHIRTHPASPNEQVRWKKPRMSRGGGFLPTPGLPARTPRCPDPAAEMLATYEAKLKRKR
jgi:hypothetical protein